MTVCEKCFEEIRLEKLPRGKMTGDEPTQAELEEWERENLQGHPWRERCKRLIAALEAARQERDEANNDIGKVQDDLHDAQEEVGTREDALATQSKIIHQQEEEIATLRRELAEARAELESSTSAMNNLARKLTEAEEGKP
jgi:chromosome segregation ATPase